jgi:hypothetical protein
LDLVLPHHVTRQPTPDILNSVEVPTSPHLHSSIPPNHHETRRDGPALRLCGRVPRADSGERVRLPRTIIILGVLLTPQAEIGSKNHEVVPTSLIAEISGIRGGNVNKCLGSLAKRGLVARVQNIRCERFGRTWLMARRRVQAHVRRAGLPRAEDVFEEEAGVCWERGEEDWRGQGERHLHCQG